MKVRDVPPYGQKHILTPDGDEYYVCEVDLYHMRAWVFDKQTGTYHWLSADTPIAAHRPAFSPKWNAVPFINGDCQ